MKVLLVGRRVFLESVLSGRFVVRPLRIAGDPVGLKRESTDSLESCIFGCPNFEGVASFYYHAGHEVFLLPDESFALFGAALLDDYDIFDFQFSGAPPHWVVALLKKKGKNVRGCLNPLCLDKFQFARLLQESESLRGYVPRQAAFYTPSSLLSFSFREHFAASADDYFIAKALASAESRFPDGSDYSVFQAEGFGPFAEGARRHPLWWPTEKSGASDSPPSPVGKGVLISQFLLTNDGTASGENGVVHKIPMPVGWSRKKFERWPLSCQKMMGHCTLEPLGKRIAPFGDVFKYHRWEEGHLEPYRSVLWELSEKISLVPCLACVDMMIDQDGTPYFLEVNRLAGNLLIQFQGDSACVLERYMSVMCAR